MAVIDDQLSTKEYSDKILSPYNSNNDENVDPEKVKAVIKRMKEEDSDSVEDKLSNLMGENMFVKEILNQSAKAIADADEELDVKCMLEDLGHQKEDPDPYGDGEQHQLFGADAMKLQAQTAKRMNYDFENNSKLSNWARACYVGDKSVVVECLNQAAAKSSAEVSNLIEKRESLMRFSGLFHVILGVQNSPSKLHVQIAKLLIDKGARVNAKDIGGSTPLHHCMSQFGNSYSLEIARVLVANGGSINSINRFGATALFEPCITLNYEYIEFLVCQGCNPKYVDSFGVSCYAYASMNQKIASIFSKGNCRMAEKEKWIQKLSGKENLIDACSFCGGKDKGLKKCSGCLAAGYCSATCQKSHWKAHKRLCKAKQSENKRNDMVLIFNPVTEVEKSSRGKRGKPSLTDGRNVNAVPVEKAMRVKIQVTFALSCKSCKILYPTNKIIFKLKILFNTNF